MTSRATENDPLDLRAWALQERELATRFISFTGAELQWNCRQLQACECRSIPSPAQPLFPHSTSLLSHSMETDYQSGWIEIVEEYTSRNLTKVEDKLPALAGLASRFKALTGFSYVAGLWKEQLLSDIVWQRDSSRLESPTTYLGPTFSWVSICGPVNYRFARHSYAGVRRYHSKLLNVDYATADGRPYSRAVEGSMTFRGHTISVGMRSPSLMEAQAYRIHIGDKTYSPNTNQRTTCEFAVDTPLISSVLGTEQEEASYVSRAKLSEDEGERMEGSIKLLSLYSIHDPKYLFQTFLILGRSRNNAEKYERIGVGSGKIYYSPELSHDESKDLHLVEPFKWLSVDLGREGRAFGGATEEIVCIV